MDNLPGFHVVNVIKSQLAACKATATSPRTAVKVGHREFYWQGEQIFTLAWYGRSAWGVACTEDEAIALARNHAHVVSRRGHGRNLRADFQIVMGSGR